MPALLRLGVGVVSLAQRTRPWAVTTHAAQQYRREVAPGASVYTARHALLRLLATARYVETSRWGNELWATPCAPGVALVVQRKPARRWLLTLRVVRPVQPAEPAGLGPVCAACKARWWPDVRMDRTGPRCLECGRRTA